MSESWIAVLPVYRTGAALSVCEGVPLAGSAATVEPSPEEQALLALGLGVFVHSIGFVDVDWQRKLVAKAGLGGGMMDWRRLDPAIAGEVIRAVARTFGDDGGRYGEWGFAEVEQVWLAQARAMRGLLPSLPRGA